MARTIKIYTDCNEYTNTHYYRMFKVVDELPTVGDDYEDGTVTELKEVRKDIGRLYSDLPQQPQSHGYRTVL